MLIASSTHDRGSGSRDFAGCRRPDIGDVAALRATDPFYSLHGLSTADILPYRCDDRECPVPGERQPADVKVGDAQRR